MCDNWRQTFFNKLSCKGVVQDDGFGKITVRGQLKSGPSNSTVLYWAASPPNYRTGFTGSALPYANPEMAHQMTPNRGVTKANGGHFEFQIMFPNSYYTGLGTVYMPPHVFVKVCDENGEGEIQTIKLGEGVPFRMLTYPNVKGAARDNATFYAGRDRFPVRTQEEILIDSGYPETDKMPENFWGMAVPHP